MHRIALKATMTATLLLMAVTGPATANSLALSSQRLDVAWTELTIVITGTPFVSCPLSLAGSFHGSTFAKTPGSLIGHVTNAGLSGACSEGAAATVLSETLPWHIQYDSFTSSLPEIASVNVRIIGMSARIAFRGLTCLARTTVTQPARFAAVLDANGVITELIADETTGIDLEDEIFICAIAGRGRISGAGTVAEGPRVTLI